MLCHGKRKADRGMKLHIDSKVFDLKSKTGHLSDGISSGDKVWSRTEPIGAFARNQSVKYSLNHRGNQQLLAQPDENRELLLGSTGEEQVIGHATQVVNTDQQTQK